MGMNQENKKQRVRGHVDKVNETENGANNVQASQNEASAPSGSESSVDCNSFMNEPPPSWRLVKLFRDYTAAQVRSDQSAISRCDSTHELLRNVVSIVCAMSKVDIVRAMQISKLMDEVSRLNDIVESVHGGGERGGMTEPHVFQAVAACGRKRKYE